VPDATGLELVAAEVREALGDNAVAGTSYYRGQATLEIAPQATRDVVEFLMREAKEPYDFLASLHGCDYFPEEPRLSVHYQLLSRERIDRLCVKARLGADAPEVPSITELFPGAAFDERETYDMFGIVFTGNPDLRRILMPEDYVGWPQRRDFPIGGEPVIFTFNEKQMPRWYE
jgi:NADH-quinone oxidoreductase subunit C